MQNQKTLDQNHQWMPDYIGLGAMKSASAWINQCLREHPEICSTGKKEMHFFDSDTTFNKGLAHYKSLFPQDNEQLVGEITPSYLYEPSVPARIHQYFPKAKFIVCLRDPADRAWSHYKYGQQMHGRLSIYSSFSEAFTADRSLADNGRYGEQLERYLTYFNKDQIKILFYEDLRGDPVAAIQDVYRFLGLKNTTYEPTAITQRVNQTGDREVVLKHERLWRVMLKIRKLLHKYPKIEAFIKSRGLIYSVKMLARKDAQVKKTTSVKTVATKLSISDRQLVLNELLPDILKLEKITGRNLEKWKL